MASQIATGLFIGLMSGTSLDGVDGVLVEFTGQQAPTVRAHVHHGFSAELVNELLALNSAGGNELHRAALASNAVARAYAEIVTALLEAARVTPSQVIAIGAHGQTVRHCPGLFDGSGYTLQLCNGALLAELTGIDVIADFRSRDVAAGGQGAPLVPAFHRAMFGRDHLCTGILNIGGISNLSVLAADGSTSGFDCGPGNVLMDHWCLLHCGEPYDRDGSWAASGTINRKLLGLMQNEAYFAAPPPKSTGRDLFNPAWLTQYLQQATAMGEVLSPVDVQATLCELTAWCCQQSMAQFAPDARLLLVCGGGAYNGELMRRLAHRLPQVSVESTKALGLAADQVEAVAFAWLASTWMNRHPGNLPAVTGARGPRILGALYPAG
ncbi:MAG: anhydro-N-acetylmuramic acid kinase [Burkholderiales bacterium PBB1]|nr:MAG: anhydro-N-acetylmuramic acid kinase [Burkholderiales bacterium PBB1]